jgi:hypothetical protein
VTKKDTPPNAGAEAQISAPHPMLLQAVANLQALEAEMRHTVLVAGQCSVERKRDRLSMAFEAEANRIQCWVDKLGTALADLQEVKTP